MKCKNCGADITGNIIKCPYCDTSLMNEGLQIMQEALQDTDEISVRQQETIMARQTEQPAEKEETVTNELEGKIYNFCSGKGINLRALFNTRVSGSVEIKEDRILISMWPNRFNVSPAILLEDILSIELSRKISPYHLFFAIVCLVAAFSAPPFILLSLVWIYCGLNTKITITQRNGINVIMYHQNKADAEAFKEDMKKITKIQ